jgi:ribosome-binding factor A
MVFRRISRKALLSGCAQPGELDGVDPRLERHESRKVPNRKALQVCGQVFETLSQVLAGECGDDCLRDLLVEAVLPAPNAARLLVTLVPAVTAQAVTRTEWLAHLERARGLLRHEVAAAITRRKAPELIFRVLDRTG